MQDISTADFSTPSQDFSTMRLELNVLTGLPGYLLDISTASFSSPRFNLLFQRKYHGWRVHGWIARGWSFGLKNSGVKMSCNLFSGLEGLWPLYKNVFEWPPTTTSTSGTFLAISWSFSNPEWPTAMMIFTPLAFRFLASLSMDVISSRNLTFPGWEICWKIQKNIIIGRNSNARKNWQDIKDYHKHIIKLKFLVELS